MLSRTSKSFVSPEECHDPYRREKLTILHTFLVIDQGLKPQYTIDTIIVYSQETRRQILN